MKKYIIPIVAVILILIFARAILPAPEPERCAIYDSIPMHAPALVNLATGEVGSWKYTILTPSKLRNWMSSSRVVCFVSYMLQV